MKPKSLAKLLLAGALAFGVLAAGPALALNPQPEVPSKPRVYKSKPKPFKLKKPKHHAAVYTASLNA
jgi:hypothetical protein